MSKLPRLNRKMILIACCSVLLLSAITLALSIKTTTQPLPNSVDNEKSALIKQVEESPDQSLRILGNDDSPLRIVEAKVKEIPGPLFTKLTGKVTDLASVSSVPEATLINSSQQTVTRFLLAVRDPKSRTTLGVMRHKLELKPGETYLVKREYFGPLGENAVQTDKSGQVHHGLPQMDSEKRWIQFAPRSDLYAAIGRVDFEDGSNWTAKQEGGEVK
ncbi:MAG: hypothetical protein ACRD4L_07060 [Pyrinomonadaceae bacterium]